MIDLNKITPYSAFNYWFIRIDDNTYDVFDSDSELGFYTVNGSHSLSYMKELPSEIQHDFELFCNSRPENSIRQRIKFDNVEEAINLYENLLAGAILMRAHSHIDDNPDVVIPKIQRCLDWLRNTDFYTAPASTRYHESFPSGLLYHTLKVVDRTITLLECSPFLSVHPDSAILVALTHDWCKIGLYESYTRNVKNDRTGSWEPTLAYRHNHEIVPLGHGVTSMFLAQKFFKLTTEECLALRWHMGHWRVCDSEVNDLQYANENYPLVHLLQFADQLAIVKY